MKKTNLWNRLLSLALCLCMVLGVMLPMMNITVHAGYDFDDGTKFTFRITNLVREWNGTKDELGEYGSDFDGQKLTKIADGKFQYTYKAALSTGQGTCWSDPVTVTFDGVDCNSDYYKSFDITESQSVGGHTMTWTYTLEISRYKGHSYGNWSDNGDGTHIHTCVINSTHTENGRHYFNAATCSAPQTCANCTATQGEPVADAHLWNAATCVLPQTCKYCGIGQGDVLGHDIVAAVLGKPAACSRCGAMDMAIPVLEAAVINTNIDLPSRAVKADNSGYDDIAWSVVDAGSTGATISGNTLKASTPGKAVIRATIESGSKDFTVLFNAAENIDISLGSVTISKKDDSTLTVAYPGFEGGSKEYSAKQPIYITGTTSSHTVLVNSGAVADIIIDNLNISSGDFAISIKSGATATITLNGDNSLTASKWNGTALHVPIGAVLTIAGDGKLTANGTGSKGVGIGGRSNMGGEWTGTITILSGTVVASGKTGIGGGCGAWGGVGGSGGTITISGGFVSAKGFYGAGIGGGSPAGSGGTVKITGGTVVATSKYGAGIGGSGQTGEAGGSGGTVIITGGNVKATSERSEAIGRGLDGADSGTLTDGNGNDLSLQVFTLNDATADTAVTAMAGVTYGMNDVKTLDTNKLYFYLPSGSNPIYFAAGDTVYCSAGGNGGYSTTNHSLGKTYTVDGDIHYRQCSVCGSICNKDVHSGGTPDCLNTGSCAVCGVVYLSMDPNTHVAEDTYIEYIDDNHHGLYHTCCKALISEIAHTPAEGQEATCVGVATCAECGIAYGGTDTTNHTSGETKYISNGNGTHILTHVCCGNPAAAPESHKVTYTVNGERTIDAVCKDCGATGSATFAPTAGGIYNGYVFASSYSATGILKGWNAFAKPAITGCCEGGCKNVGEHTVTMTLGDQSVSAAFTVTHKTLTISKVEAHYKSYDGTSDLDVYGVSLDGVVVYDEGDYDGEWDDVRDDVKLVYKNLVYTIDDIVPGYYDTVDVSGVTITGNDASNYVIAESFENVPLLDSMGYDFEIHNAQIWITAYDQLLTGDEQLDQSQYSIEGLDEQFTIEGISLYENGYSQIEIDPYSISIYLDGENVTDYFDITTYPGNLSRVCEGHEYDANGFCATGECNSYEAAVRVDEVDEWDCEVTYYDIYNAGQLYWFAEQVNTYGNNYINGRLMADITVNEDLTAENLRIWTPIGKDWPTYCGMFKGNDYTVSGLYVCDPEKDYVGLFGGTDYNNSISNIHLTNSYFEGDSRVGGLFGYAGSNISGCTVSDSVTVKGNSYLGGIAGDSASGELTNSWSAATVTANENGYSYGGLVGNNCLSINNCYTTESSLFGSNRASYGGSVNNSYYLSEEETEDGGKTAAQFASGEVAYLLQGGVQSEDIYDDEGNHVETVTPEIWGQNIGTDRYPVLGGAKVYQAVNCKNETAYSNTTESVIHAWKDGVCTACGEKDPDYVQPVVIPTITLKYPSLSFESEVFYNVYFTVTNAEVKVEDLGLLTWYNRPANTAAATYETAEEIIPGAVYNAGADMYMVRSQGVPAKKLGDNMYIRVYAKLSDGTYAYSPVTYYNAKMYASDILKNSQSAEMKALVVAMLNYGAAAQVHFNHNADSLMNASLTAEQKALVKAYSSDMIGAVITADTNKVGTFKSNGGFSSGYPSVSFEGAFSINYYLAPKQTVEGDMTLYCWDLETYNSVSTLTEENATAKITMTKGGTQYVGSYAGIAAKQIDETVFVAAVYTSGGVRYSSPVISYSLGAYCAEQIAKGSATMQEFAKTTAVYGNYAKAYFASLNG